MTREVVKNHNDFPELFTISQTSHLPSMRSIGIILHWKVQDASVTLGALTLSNNEQWKLLPKRLAATKTVTRSLERSPPLHKSPRKDKVLTGVIFQNSPVSSALKISLFWNSSLISFSCINNQ